MVIEGVRGAGIEGDIAIDDVTIEEGECKDPPPNSEYSHIETLLAPGGKRVCIFDVTVSLI